MNVRMGAELPEIEEAAKMDFLLAGVMYPIISLIFTDPATFGVGNDGNSITNCVLAAMAEVTTTSKVRSITVASAEKRITPPILKIMLILLLLKLSKA